MREPSEPKEPEQSFPSTTWEWRKAKIKAPHGRNAQSARRAVRWTQMPMRMRRDPLTIKVTWRGGPECWYQVNARGSWGRFPGHLSFHDVMATIYGEHQFPEK